MSWYVEASSPKVTSQNHNVLISDFPCEASVIVTDAVRIDSGVAKKAKADVLGTSNVVGIVESKSSSTLCTIRVSGVTGEIFTGLDESKEYVLSPTTAGLIEALDVPTYGTGNIVLRVGMPLTSTRMVVSKGVRFIKA